MREFALHRKRRLPIISAGEFNTMNIQHAHSATPVKGDRLCLQIPALPAQVGKARHAVVDFLRYQGWPQMDTDAVALAIGEAGSNAVCYGKHEDAASVVSIVCTLLNPLCLQIEVRNRGTEFRPNLDALCALPDNEATHGRGFALMQYLMDEMQVFQEGPETVVRLTKSRTV